MKSIWKRVEVLEERLRAGSCVSEGKVQYYHPIRYNWEDAISVPSKRIDDVRDKVPMFTWYEPFCDVGGIGHGPRSAPLSDVVKLILDYLELYVSIQKQTPEKIVLRSKLPELSGALLSTEDHIKLNTKKAPVTSKKPVRKPKK
jgi:hypothetical protein